MAQLYIDTIKNGLDLANGEDSIEIFDLLFDRETLSVANLRPEENGMPDSYQWDIIGNGPKGDRRVPLIIVFQEEDPRFFSPLSNYGKQSCDAVKIYLNYLMEEEGEELSRWLSIDSDSNYFLDEANSLIEYYSKYDMSKTKIISFDYNYDTDKFVYTVQDANGEIFEVLMIYGDGFSMPDIYSIIN